jgi:hypothetical protein
MASSETPKQELDAAARGLIINLMNLRTRALQHMLREDDRRDIRKECGHPHTITIEMLQDLYDRNPIAARVVEVMPKESWQVVPEVYEDEDAKVTTPFEQAWGDLGKQLRGQDSYFTGSQTQNFLWEYLLRADIISGIGRYGIILVGTDNRTKLDRPLPFGGENGQGNTKLNYLRVFPESAVEITAYDEDELSPRYQQPTEYQLTFGNPSATAAQSDIASTAPAPNSVKRKVHWTRIIHVADNITSSETFGVPRCQQVYDRLLDLNKIYGSTAEGVWRGAFIGVSLESNPQLGGDVNIDEEKMKNMMEAYGEGLQRYLVLLGMQAKSLAPQVVDTTPQIESQLQAVCIKLGIPMRIFKGSERGELASSQDDQQWNDRVRQRQRDYVTPRLIVPVIDRFIQLGILPIPTQGYKLWWPDLTSQTDTERAQIGFLRSQTLAQYAQAGVSMMVSPSDFLSRVMAYNEQEAQTMSENAKKAGPLALPPGQDPNATGEGSSFGKNKGDK